MTTDKNTNRVHPWAKGFRFKRNGGKVFHPYTYLNFNKEKL
jgi:hypothetical protein